MWRRTDNRKCRFVHFATWWVLKILAGNWISYKRGLNLKDAWLSKDLFSPKSSLSLKDAWLTKDLFSAKSSYLHNLYPFGHQGNFTRTKQHVVSILLPPTFTPVPHWNYPFKHEGVVSRSSFGRGGLSSLRTTISFLPPNLCKMNKKHVKAIGQLHKHSGRWFPQAFLVPVIDTPRALSNEVLKLPLNIY